MAKGKTEMAVREDGVAVITIVNPPVNALSFDGTQRLPHLIGLPKSLEMMILSKSIKGKEAHSLGLIDAIASPTDLISAACLFAFQIADHKRPWVKTIHGTDRLPSSEESRQILNFARTQAQKQAPNVNHPLVCIDVIEEGIVSGPQAGLIKETNCAKELQASQTSKSLIHVFFAQRATSKVPGITNIGLVPRKIKKVAIVGGGLMGSGIATALLLDNISVILKEINEKFLQSGIARIRGEKPFLYII